MKKTLRGLFYTCLLSTPLSLAQPLSAKEWIVYFGTYTRGESKGIYQGVFDDVEGSLKSIKLSAETQNPSFTAISPDGKYLYAVGEGDDANNVGSYEIQADGSLKPINRVSSKGKGACHITLSKDGRVALVANYSSGDVSSHLIQKDGSLSEAVSFEKHTGSGPDQGRQKAPHAHGFYVAPGDRFAVCPDLGIDQVVSYAFNASEGTLTPKYELNWKIAPGAGPRHLDFHPQGAHAAVVNELDNTVTLFTWNGESGKAQETQVINTLPEDFKGTSYTAEIQWHPSGKFLFASNRGHDSIAIFTVEGSGESLRLKASGHASTQGKNPRHFIVDPSGQWLLVANQDSGNAWVYQIDLKTGALTPKGEETKVPWPVCIQFKP